MVVASFVVVVTDVAVAVCVTFAVGGIGNAQIGQNFHVSFAIGLAVPS